MLLKRYNEPIYQKSYNQPFNNFPKNIGFNNGLLAAQPDMVEGLDLPAFKPFPIHEKLSGAATVYSGPEATPLPHIAGEWEGPGKDMIQAQTQAAYDGASMVYDRNEACSFLGSPDPTGHAYVQTFTTDGTTLNTFMHYSSESNGQVKYHQFPTSRSFLTSTYEDFKRSRQRLRNQQDDAKEHSENLRDKLNEKWLADQHQPPASTDGPRVLTTDDGHNPDALHTQNYDPPVTSPYSSENVSPPLELHEDVDDLKTGGHKRTQQSLGHTANSKARKRR